MFYLLVDLGFNYVAMAYGKESACRFYQPDSS